MTAGVNVPGFLGYEVGAPLPTLVQILDGTPPANSAPVTVIAVPGSSYHYSGGGFEIAEALIDDVAGASFVEAMDRLVLKPAGMRHSTFAQPLPQPLAPKSAKGHLADGMEVSGGFHVFPSTRRPVFGRRRPTSPNFFFSSAARGGAKAICSFARTRRGRC